MTWPEGHAEQWLPLLSEGGWAGGPGKQLTERKGEAWPREEGGEAGPRGCKGLRAVGKSCSHPSIHLLIQYRWSQESVRCGFKS